VFLTWGHCFPCHSSSIAAGRVRVLRAHLAVDVVTVHIEQGNGPVQPVPTTAAPLTSAQPKWSFAGRGKRPVPELRVGWL